jgi:acyl carrier protein
VAAAIKRRLIERKLKEMLLEKAVRNRIDLRELADWLYESAGIKVGKITWDNIKRAILRADEITAQELAVYLMEEHGIRIDEREWLRILRSFGLTTTTSKILGDKGRG